MSALATKDEVAIARVGGKLDQNGIWRVETPEEVFRQAQLVWAAGMAPTGCANPSAVCLILFAGYELGVSLTQALKNIVVINNRPCVWGDLLLAKCLAHPSCLAIDETRENPGTDQEVARCYVKRKLPSGAEREVEVLFGVEDAKKAGLWGNEKKDIWRKYGRRMLQMRARAWALRDSYADVLGGLDVVESYDDFASERQNVRVKGTTSPATFDPEAIKHKREEVRQAAEGPQALPEPSGDVIDFAPPSDAAEPVPAVQVAQVKPKGKGDANAEPPDDWEPGDDPD
jgi:hypothetical protein